MFDDVAHSAQMNVIKKQAKRHTAFRLPVDTLMRLGKVSKSTNRSRAVIVEMALEAFFKK